MYSTVPITAPSTVASAGRACCQLQIVDDRGIPGHGPATGRPVDRAMPKSMINASSSSSIMMLAGLRSRWTTSALCASTRPETTERAIRSARTGGSRPSCRSTRGEVGALDVRHRDVLDAADLTEIVNADDVPVRDLPREQQLALETPLDFGRRLRIGHHFGANHLDGDRRPRVPHPTPDTRRPCRRSPAAG